MDGIVERLSSYDILNNLIPGAFFVMLCTWFDVFSLPVNNVTETLFVYYFFGLIISRIGSLIVEPICKKSKFVSYAPTAEYIHAAKLDPKIELLLETNNLYRTCTGMILTLIVCKVYIILSPCFEAKTDTTFWIVSVSLFLLFLFSYRKQTLHIYKRILCTKQTE